METTPVTIRRARPLLGTFVEITAAGPVGRATDAAVEAAFPRHLIARLVLRDEALASSAGRLDPARSMRAQAPANIDPRHREAVSTRGATVRAPTCMVADALTKVVMVAPAAAPLAHYRADALVVAADGDIRVTAGWPDSRAA